jgi:mitogen-activated protein kinase 1/3
MQSQTIAGIQYNVGDRYDVKKLLGAGAYGHVALAYDRRNNNGTSLLLIFQKSVQ